MTFSVPILALGLVLLYIGGEALVKGASAVAQNLGITPLAIGLTVVAFGTSLPELTVSVDAALSGAQDIALGNVVGSNIANILLILGIASCIAPTAVTDKIVRIDAPIMVLASLILLFLLADGSLARGEGALLLLLLIGFTVFTFRFTRRLSNGHADEDDQTQRSGPPGTLAQISRIFLGLAALVIGGHLVVTGAIDIAEVLGISQAVIGLTIVAVGTSLPELTTSVIAALRREGDIAIGNVVGSNIFNILCILGITSVISPLERGGISWFELWLMVMVAILLTVLLYLRSGLKRPEGVFLLASFAGYTSWLLST